MQRSREIINQVKRKKAASSSGSPTEVGQKGSSKASSQAAPQPTPAHVDAINQLFTEFELAYHNQFHKAFGTPEQVQMGQQLWLHALCDLPPEHIMVGARAAIKTSAYLPSPHTVRQCCLPDLDMLGLPNVRSAYTEACLAPSPKAQHTWTHPAVYFAGRATDWYVLANNPEERTFPVFKQHYEALCQRVLKGEALSMPLTKAIPETVETPLSRKACKQQLKALRDKLGV